MTISGFVAYVKQAWKNKPDTSTPLSAARLTHVEEGVKANSDAITKIAAAVINQQANDANKIPSSALMYSVNEKVDSTISDLEKKTATADLTGGNLQLRSKLYTGAAASGIVATSRNNPVSFENVSGQLLVFIDSNQIGYLTTCPTNPVTFTVESGRVKMYVDNIFMGYISTTTK